MRQVGVLAAPGLIALRDGPSGMIERLAEDHDTARQLAHGLASMPEVAGLDPDRVRTNFVLFRVPDREPFLEALAARGVLMVPYPHGFIRGVTHHGVSASDIDRAVVAVRATLSESAGSRLPEADPVAAG
jgi:threonine aldolase